VTAIDYILPFLCGAIGGWLGPRMEWPFGRIEGFERLRRAMNGMFWGSTTMVALLAGMHLMDALQ
jgi:hypothetical protein